jgi:hypothetical protein
MDPPPPSTSFLREERGCEGEQGLNPSSSPFSTLNGVGPMTGCPTRVVGRPGSNGCKCFFGRKTTLVTRPISTLAKYKIGNVA